MPREMLVGLRFPADAQVRAGMGSVVVEALPIAGPVYLQPLSAGYKSAVCDGCGHQSKLFKRMDAVRRWAHRHRCGRTVDGDTWETE